MMMKTAFVIAMLMVTFMFAGCESLTEQKDVDAAYKAESTLQGLQAESGDQAFWGSVSTVKQALKSAVVENRDMVVDFRLTDADGEDLILDDLYNYRIKYINDEVRSLAASKALYYAVKNDKVKKAHDAGKQLAITGTIIRWNEPSHGLGAVFHSVNTPFSVVDLDNDGKWDYVAEGKFYFSDDDSVSATDKDGNALGFGHVTTNDAKLIPVKENTDLTGLYELVISK